MTEPLEQVIERALTAWMIGAGDFGARPEVLRDLPQEEAALRLLVLAGQQRALTLRPVAPSVAPRQELPELELPLLPDSHRANFRRLLAEPLRGRELDLVRFLAGRGYAAHPFDWFPSLSNDEVPRCYDAWRDWLAGEHGLSPVEEAITAENFEEFGPSQRRNAFAALRAVNPGAARELFASHGKNLPAQERKLLLDSLQQGLSPEDAPLLQDLAENDRSSIVKKEAQRLLARLGRLEGEGPTLELVEALAVERRGLLTKKLVVATRQELTPASTARLVELIDLCDPGLLTERLGVSLLDLVCGWQRGKGDAVLRQRFLTALLNRLADVLPDESLADLSGALMEESPPRLDLPRLAYDRLPLSLKERLAGCEIASVEELAFLESLARYCGVLTEQQSAELLDRLTKLLKPVLLANAKEGSEDDSEVQAGLESSLIEAGLLLCASDARRLLDDLTASGLMTWSFVRQPGFKILKFNAELERAAAR